ncbi:MAG: hypothetical protein GY862_19285, partial [Gammaproteobacteria bacterium]|nr:hypothetical protein [Gammaproteobacteria bacterium]
MAGGMDLKAELDGKKALAKLERVLRATDKPQVFLKDIGEYLLRAHFDR